MLWDLIHGVLFSLPDEYTEGSGLVADGLKTSYVIFCRQSKWAIQKERRRKNGIFRSPIPSPYVTKKTIYDVITNYRLDVTVLVHPLLPPFGDVLFKGTLWNC